jgi:vacuolar-type H+-ATPase subunit D/Vma8
MSQNEKEAALTKLLKEINETLRRQNELQSRIIRFLEATLPKGKR